MIITSNGGSTLNYDRAHREFYMEMHESEPVYSKLYIGYQLQSQSKNSEGLTLNNNINT